MKMIRELTDREINSILKDFLIENPSPLNSFEYTKFARAVLDAAWIKQQSDVDVKTS